MSNTGDGKKLATFNIEAETWEAFKVKAREDGANASALLNQWVRTYLDKNSISNLGIDLDDTQTNQSLIVNEESLIERLAPTLAQQVRAEIEFHLGDLVNNLIDANLPAAVEVYLGKE